jgi:SAM-dependent methyltransferase
MADEEIVSHFGRRAASYGIGHWVHSPEVLICLLSLAEFLPGADVIDIGAGTGTVLKAVIGMQPKIGQCVALDVSREMLNKVLDDRVVKCCADAHDIPYPSEYFDVAICRQSLHYMEDVSHVLAETHRVLRIGGTLLLGQITPFGVEDADYWRQIIALRQPLRKHFFTADALVQIIRDSSFDVTQMTSIVTDESLRDWLGRYECSSDKASRITELLREAPMSYKVLHKVRVYANDIKFKSCWTIIQAMKLRTLPAN